MVISLPSISQEVKLNKAENAWKPGVKDPKVVVMIMQYSACFGTELAMNNQLATHFRVYFQMKATNAGALASSFGGMNLTQTEVTCFTAADSTAWLSTDLTNVTIRRQLDFLVVTSAAKSPPAQRAHPEQARLLPASPEGRNVAPAWARPAAALKLSEVLIIQCINHINQHKKKNSKQSVKICKKAVRNCKSM